MRNGFVRRSKREMDEAPHLARFLLLHEIQWIKALPLRRKRYGKPRRIEAGNGSHSALAGKQVAPDLGRSLTYSTQQPNACNNDPSCHSCDSLTAFRVFLYVLFGVFYGFDLLCILVRNFQV